MPITIDGNGTITGASTLATTVASPTLTTPNINSAQFATVSGTAPIYPCRAWVNFNGTGTVAIRASGNVTSISDNGTGSYNVNFTTVMPDANYSVNTTGDATTAIVTSTLASASAPTTATVRIASYNLAGTSTDCAFYNVTIFR